MGGSAQVKGGAETVAGNPVQRAKDNQNTKTADEFLHGHLAKWGAVVCPGWRFVLSIRICS
jgi:hypothetical protein